MHFQTLKESTKKAQEDEYYAVRTTTYERSVQKDLEVSLVQTMQSLVNPGAIIADLRKRMGELEEHASYLMDIYFPQENLAEPMGLSARLEAAPECIKALVLDTGKITVTMALASVKHHAPEFDLLKVAEDVDLSELMESEDVKAATEEVMKKVDL